MQRLTTSSFIWATTTTLLLLAVVSASSSWCDEAGWTREWIDEFDGDELDINNWSVVCNDMSGENCGALPFATSTNGAECRSATCVPEAVIVGDGVLTLVSDRSPNNSSVWTTGAVKTMNKKSWSHLQGTYRMCISAKLPGGGAKGTSDAAGQGIWPAHWMMPEDDSCDPDEGEMDIMEMVSGDGMLWSTYHWQDNWPKEKCAYPEGHQEVYGQLDMMSTSTSDGEGERKGRGSASDWAAQFHEYGVERSKDYVAFTVDGKVLVNSSTTDQAAELDVKLWPMPFYLIINTAVGGSWPGEPDDTTEAPTYHIIDYVSLSRGSS